MRRSDRKRAAFALLRATLAVGLGCLAGSASPAIVGCTAFGRVDEPASLPGDAGPDDDASDAGESAGDEQVRDGGATSRCGYSFHDSFERLEVGEETAWQVNQRARSKMGTSNEWSRTGSRSLRIAVEAMDGGPTTGSFLRYALDKSCVELSLFVRIGEQPTGDLFAALISGPRLDGGGGGGAGANVDIRVLVRPGRWMHVGEQLSGGGAYNELGKIQIPDDKWHEFVLYVSSAGTSMDVVMSFDGKEIVQTGKPALPPGGPLHTAILGPSYAHPEAAAVLFFDDVSLR